MVISKMHIWVDADACPNVIKEILYRAAIRTKIPMTLVSNHPLYTPASSFIKKKVVGSGFDVADQEIVREMQRGDLVITADIPLADKVIDKGGVAIDPRGVLYTKLNIKQRLSLRNFNAELREAGVIRGGPSTLGKKETQNFANCLDKCLMANR
jgi:uncharacterized protein YaiI (UPF0178 family)